MPMHSEHKEGFMSEKDIEEHFVREGAFPKGNRKDPYPMTEWFKANNDHPKAVPHMDPLGGHFDCDLLVDEWLRFFLTLPAGVNPLGMSSTGYVNSYPVENGHLFNAGKNEYVYFVAKSPKSNEKVRITLRKKCAVLVPIYYAETSAAETPSQNEKQMLDLVKKDLGGLTEVSAYLDNEPVYGCAVIRNIPLPIQNIPKDNVLAIPFETLLGSNYSIDLYHAGLWLLLKKDNFKSGDHEIEFTAKSINYSNEGIIEVSALV